MATNIKIKTHVVKELPTERPLEKGSVYKVQQPNGDLLTYTIDSSGNPVLERGITNDQNTRLERLSSEQISKVESITTGDITKLKEDYTREEIDQELNDVRNFANSSRINLNGSTVLPVPPRRPDNTVIEDAWVRLTQNVTYTQAGGDPLTGIDGHETVAEWNNEDGEWVLVDMGELPQTPVVDNVTSTSTTEALSANQGKVLNDKVDLKVSRIDLFDEGSAQLFNINAEDVILGGYLNNTGDVTTPSSTYNTTGFIELDTLTNSHVSYSFGRYRAFYDSNKTYIAGTYVDTGNTANHTVEIPSGARYIRITCPFTAVGGVVYWSTLMVNYGSLVLPFETFEPKTIKEDLIPDTPLSDGSVTSPKLAQSSVTTDKVANSSITENKLSFAEEHQGSNQLFNVNDPDVEIGRYLNISGTTSANATYNTSGYIPVDPSINNQVRFSEHRFSAFYDENKVFIASSLDSTSAKNTIRTIPANARFTRVTAANALSGGVIPWDILMVNYGTDLLPLEQYVAPYYLLKGVKVESAVEEVLVFLPEHIYVAVGRTIEIYNKQAIWAGNMDNFHVLWSGVGKSMKRKWSLTGTPENVGDYELTLKVFDNKMNQVGMAITTVHIVSSVLSSPKIITAIGDSLTNTKAWQPELITLSSGMISYQGTRGAVQNTPNRTHEGRSGARASYYLGNNSYTFDASGQVGNDGRTQDLNPFWNPNTNQIDWQYYKSNYNKNPTDLMIWLGTNGIALDSTQNVNDIKSFIDGLLSTGLDVPIYVVLTLYRGDQDGIGNQTGSDGYVANVSWKLQEDRKVFNLQANLYDALKDYTDLHFIPVSLCHDSEYNFTPVGASTPVNPRAWQTESLPSEATHPQQAGYFQIADIMFSVIAGT